MHPQRGNKKNNKKKNKNNKKKNKWLAATKKDKQWYFDRVKAGNTSDTKKLQTEMELMLLDEAGRAELLTFVTQLFLEAVKNNRVELVCFILPHTKRMNVDHGTRILCPPCPYGGRKCKQSVYNELVEGLTYACDQGFLKITEVLAPELDPRSLSLGLYHACEANQLDVAEYLCDAHKAGVEYLHSEKRQSVLGLAVQQGTPEVLRFLVNRFPSDWNFVDLPLEFDLSAVKFLIREGVFDGYQIVQAAVHLLDRHRPASAEEVLGITSRVYSHDVDKYLSMYLKKSPGRPWPEPEVLVRLSEYLQTGQGQLLPDPYLRQKILSEVFSRVRRHEATGVNPTGGNLRGAWCLFGRALLTGSEGLDADPDRGMKYLLKSGTPDAFYHLGIHCSQGSGDLYPKALRYFLQAANANHPGALFELGQHHLDRDAKESYLKKAADKNHKGAQSMLAMLYSKHPGGNEYAFDLFTKVAKAGLKNPSDTSLEVVRAWLNVGSESMCRSVSSQNPTMMCDFHKAMKMGVDESMVRLAEIQAAEASGNPVLAKKISESPGIQWQYFQDKVAYSQAALFWFSTAALVGGDHNAYTSVLECLVVGCCSGVGQHPSVVFERILRKFVTLNPEKEVLERIFAQVEMVDLGVDVPYLRLVSGLSARPIMELYRQGDENAIFNLAQQSFRLETNSFGKGFRLLLHAAKKGHEEAQAWAKRLDKYPDDKFKELLCCPRIRTEFCEALTQQAVSAELSKFYPDYRHHGETRYVRRHLMSWKPLIKMVKPPVKPRRLKKLVDDRVLSTCGYCYREEEPGEHFSACGRCRVVYYCSVLCQKKHWFHSLVSHKNTCQAHGRSPVVRALDPRGSLCYLLSSWMKIDIPDGVQEFCIG